MVRRRIVDPRSGEEIDDALVVMFQAPASYTGENMVEIHCHGSVAVLHAVMEAVAKAGARPAKPGEFTLRAFVNGKMDLAQAEAVQALVGAQTRAAGRAALVLLQGGLSRRVRELRQRLVGVLASVEALLEFPEEAWAEDEIARQQAVIEAEAMRVKGLLGTHKRGRRLTDGASVVLVGRANVGKSSIFNRLVGYTRAVVDEEPGTTRDFVEARVELAGFTVRFVDTAGYRTDSTEAEAKAVELARAVVGEADLVVCVADGHGGVSSRDEDLWRGLPDNKRLAVLNKADLGLQGGRGSWQDALVVSARTGRGLDALQDRIVSELGAGFQGDGDDVVVIEERQHELLTRCFAALQRAEGIVRSGREGELAALDLRNAVAALDAIVGIEVDGDVLDEIFSRFCIGK